MSQKNAIDRQKTLNIVVELDIDRMGAGNEYVAKLPQGAVVLAVVLITDTAFDSVTTATATITDGTTVFANGVDVKSTGTEVTANAPKYYPIGGELTFSLAETGAAATLGHAIAIVSYVQLGAGGDICGCSENHP